MRRPESGGSIADSEHQPESGSPDPLTRPQVRIAATGLSSLGRVVQWLSFPGRFLTRGGHPVQELAVCSLPQVPAPSSPSDDGLSTSLHVPSPSFVTRVPTGSTGTAGFPCPPCRPGVCLPAPPRCAQGHVAPSCLGAGPLLVSASV